MGVLDVVDKGSLGMIMAPVTRPAWIVVAACSLAAMEPLTTQARATDATGRRAATRHGAQPVPHRRCW